MRRQGPKFVTNQTPAKTELKGRHCAVTVNLLPKLTRNEKLEGKDYLAVPMVMMTEGVHCGSDGPLYYPSDELGKTPVIWNHKPVVVYHPEMNGVSLSACEKEIIENRKVGIIMNAHYEGKRLKAEAWLDKSKVDAVDKRIMSAIKKNSMMEVSTGLFVDVESATGSWNGEDYTGIARNYRPDHLALLPDQIGACSLDDGAGLLRNTALVGDRKSFLSTLTKLVKRMGLEVGPDGPVQNELSFSDIESQLWRALRERFSPHDGSPLPFVCGVYSNFVVYEFVNKLYQLDYDTTEVGVKLGDGPPVPVVRVVEYRTVENTNNNSQNIVPVMKKQHIDKILTANKGWAEKDRASLEAMTDSQVEIIHNGIFPPTPTPAPAQTAPAATPTPAPAPAQAAAPAATPAAPATTPAPAPVANKVVSLDDYLATMPAEMRGMVKNGLNLHKAEKDRLVAGILANANNPFTKEQLEAKELTELQGLARLAAVSQPIYSGQQETITNANSTVKEEALEVPVLNFAKK